MDTSLASSTSQQTIASATKKAETPITSGLEFFQLPKKYQRKPISAEEADAINVSLLLIL
jgi:hypothetical protein